MNRSALPIALATVLAVASCTGAIAPPEPPGAPPAADAPQPAAVGPPPDPSPQPPAQPFEALPPLVAAAKVKDLLVGRPLTEDERAQAAASADVPRALVEAWMETPEVERKLLAFFQQAFQQDGWGEADLARHLGYFIDYNRWKSPLMTQLRSSFALTAMSFVKERRPFTEVLTTRRFLMTLPMMVLYAALDGLPRNDTGGFTPENSWLLQKYPKIQMKIDPRPPGEGRPVRQSLDPTPPAGITFPVTQSATCMPRQITGPGALYEILNNVFGWPGGCAELQAGAFTPEEATTWRWVTVRKPNPGEERTVFWDVDRLAAPTTAELVVDTPRVGFMTTPGFFATWQTNDSNQFRVTANQTLIVALGRSFDPGDTIVPLADASVDKEHAGPGTPCYGCHVSLDPLRDFFRLNYTLFYGVRPERARAGLPAHAGFTLAGGVQRSGVEMDVLADALAHHPRFAIGWVQKLCTFANAESCLADDPEVARVAAVFERSNFDFKTLLRELFTSPLVTYARATLTSDRQGGSLGIARRELLCERLINRGGFAPGCAGTAQLFHIPLLAAGIPGMGFARGAEQAIVPHDPALFSTIATERLCEEVAKGAIPGGRIDEDATLDRLVGDVMGVWRGDARFAPLRAALAEHAKAQRDGGLSSTDALRQTFVVACLSPLMSAVGL